MAFGKPKKEKVLKTVTAASSDKSERQKSIDAEGDPHQVR
jgi:hypothetical protein